MVTRIKVGIQYWGQLLLLPIYWISFITPRNKNIWLFGSTFGRRFADNPRYLYLYIANHKECGLRPIWISHKREIADFLTEKGYEAYYGRSFRGIWYCLRGEIYLFDNYSKDISFWLSGGALKINLWHGTGNKKANHDNKFDRYRHPKNLWERFITFPRRLSDEKPNHYTLATSEALAVITSSAFNTPMEHVIIDGYPRNDAILDRTFPNLYTDQEKTILNNILRWKNEGKRMDLYMPTFRASEPDFFKVMDLKLFNEYLYENDIMFIVKLHPKSKLRKEFSEIRYSNIINVDQNLDPYTFLGHIDILTVDYSSVYSDFMLLGRPVISFFYDFDKYSSYTREAYISFDEYMPELRATNMTELMDNTLKVLQEDFCKDKRMLSCDRMFQYKDAQSSKRLVEKIKKLV